MSLAANAVRVTAAIPCYNGARWIHATVRSLLNQTRLPDEVLVIDDGSSDASAARASAAGARVVRHAVNRGLAVGRNTALAAAAGDILVFIDVDATADPRLVETLLAGFSGPDIAGVGGGGVEAHRETLADEWRARHARQWFGPRPLASAPFLFGLCAAYRRAALLRIGGFNTALRTNAEDVEVGLRLRAAGHRLVYTPAAVVYHQRADSVESLVKTMERWYYWATVVRRAHGDQPWRLYGGAVRGVTTQPLRDAADGRFDLLPLDARIAWVKARAVTRGWLERK